ncbi:MAG: hypothetical protein ABTQ32_17580 [Myxococcaceae bacterium]
MNPTARKGPSNRFMGCGVVAVLLVTTCGLWSVRSTRALLEFKRFEHTQPGTPLEAVVNAALDAGFEPWPMGDVTSQDGGVATVDLVKQHGPPVGSWHLLVNHVEGRVTSVKPVIPD